MSIDLTNFAFSIIIARYFLQGVLAATGVECDHIVFVHSGLAMCPLLQLPVRRERGNTLPAIGAFSCNNNLQPELHEVRHEQKQEINV